MKNMHSLVRRIVLLVVIFILASFAHVLAKSDMVEPDMRELKLLIDPETFSDRLAGYALCWDIVAELADEMGVKAIKADDPFAEGVRKIIYIDTDAQDVTNAGLILRLRYDVKDCVPGTKAQVTLKYREAGADAIPSDSVVGAEEYNCSYKAETDISGFSGGVVGNNKPTASLSCIIKGIEDEDHPNNTLGEFARYYPSLTRLDLPLDTKLKNAAGVAVREFKAVPGELDFGHGLVTEVEMSVWHNYDTGQLVIGEVSYEFAIEPNVSQEALDKAFEFFDAMQAEMVDIAHRPSAATHSGGMGLKTEILKSTVK